MVLRACSRPLPPAPCPQLSPGPGSPQQRYEVAEGGGSSTPLRHEAAKPLKGNGLSQVTGLEQDRNPAILSLTFYKEIEVVRLLCGLRQPSPFAESQCLGLKTRTLNLGVAALTSAPFCTWGLLAGQRAQLGAQSWTSKRG